MTPSQFIDDPDWARFLPETAEPVRKRHLPTHEDCASLDAEAAAAHLRRGGTLGAMTGYEERPGQIDMLKAVVRAFNDREHLMIEAGTGVGKSLAYLIPSVLWAWTNDTPVVVSTATRNLQSQLVSSDIPRALRVLGDNAAKFKTALLKGRGNYLCLRAVADFFASGYWTTSAAEQDAMPGFIDWLRTTPDGDLDRYDGLPRALLTCPGEECGGRRCPYYSRCFVYRARKAASEAHLVIANHSLVLAEATSAGGGILPSYGRLVLDEAHNLESIATDYLSDEFSLPALVRILNRLRRRSRGKSARTSGILAGVERQLAKGILAGSSVGERVRRLLGDAATATVRTVGAAESLADLAAKLLRVSADEDRVRYRVREGARQHSVRGLFRPYEPGRWDESEMKAAQDEFEAHLAGLVGALHNLADTLDGSTPEGEFNLCADLSGQVRGAAESLVEFANATNFVLGGEKDTHVYWAERVRPTNRPSYVRLVAAPLSVADDLRKLIWDLKDSAVLSSATLRVGNDFRYMSMRLGCEERFRRLTAESPFDYLRQALVLAPDCLPDPSSDAARYAEALASLLKDIAAETHGRALVLFTSYEMMNAVAARARPDLAAAGLDLLVQGEGLSRESMTEALRTAEGDFRRGVVLFGAQSFWEGVDVAGEALSCVILARLPFAQVGDPITEARAEKIDREGGSSFRDYMLPEAVIKFRQGFGRLIRKQSDRGVVIVTDPRLVTKSYGAVFRRSIPTSVHTVTETDDLIARVTGFFDDI